MRTSNTSRLGGARPAYNGEREKREKIKQEGREAVGESVSRSIYVEYLTKTETKNFPLNWQHRYHWSLQLESPQVTPSFGGVI